MFNVVTYPRYSILLLRIFWLQVQGLRDLVFGVKWVMPDRIV